MSDFKEDIPACVQQRRRAEMKEGEKIVSTVEWRIENVKSWDSDDVKSVVSSPDFVLNNLGDNDWKLNFHKNDQGQLDVSLSPSRFVESVSIHCDWCLMSGNRVVMLETELEDKITSRESRHHVLFAKDVPDDKDMFLSHDTLIVRLRVRKTDEGCELSEYISISTRLLRESLEESFGWTIENFSYLQLDREAVTSVYLRGHLFRVRFFLTGEVLEDAYVSFGISSENAPGLDLTATISFKGRRPHLDGKRPHLDGKRPHLDERRPHLDEMRHTFSSALRGQTWIIPKLVSRRQVLESYLCEGSVTIQCTFVCGIKNSARSCIEGSYYGPEHLNPVVASNRTSTTPEKRPRTIVTKVSPEGGVQTTLLSSCWKEESGDRESDLFQDIAGIHERNTLTDFELRTEDGGSFHVHKNILSTRSPVFKAMFCGGMAESQLNSLELPDLDSLTLEAFLSFLYSGAMPELKWESAVNLYYAADKYRVLSLKQQCSSVLRSRLTLSNLVDILELADRHQDKRLFSFVLEFVQNNFDAVVFSDEWDKFLERSPLAGKVMKGALELRRNMGPY